MCACVSCVLRAARALAAAAAFSQPLHHTQQKTQHKQEWDKIWAINKKNIDPVCPRHTAIEAEGRVLVTLSNGPSELEVRSGLDNNSWQMSTGNRYTLTSCWLHGSLSLLPTRCPCL